MGDRFCSLCRPWPRCTWSPYLRGWCYTAKEIRVCKLVILAPDIGGCPSPLRFSGVLLWSLPRSVSIQEGLGPTSSVPLSPKHPGPTAAWDRQPLGGNLKTRILALCRRYQAITFFSRRMVAAQRHFLNFERNLCLPTG